MIADVITIAVVIVGMLLMFCGVIVAWNRFVYWLSSRDLAYANRRENALSVMSTWRDDDEDVPA